jgi:hypothetical protein
MRMGKTDRAGRSMRDEHAFDARCANEAVVELERTGGEDAARTASKAWHPVSHPVWVLAIIGVMGAGAWGQSRPAVRGSLDAMTVVPATGAASQPALPAGHPAMPGMGGGGAGGMDPAMAGHMGAMGGATVGAIRVNIKQATPGGPELGKEPVTVMLFVKGVAIKTYKTALDEKGVVELHDLPVDVAFQPIITVEHQGFEQQFVGPPVNRMQPMVEMDMPVYEVTGEKPAWTIGLCDVEAEVVKAADGVPGLFFTELLGVFNPGDRAWTGAAVGGQRRTMTVLLPEGAMNVQMGPGFAEAGATVLSGSLVRGKTLLPGSSQFVFGYTLAARDGKVTASYTAPADTTLFALYLPQDVKVEKLTGLEVGTAGGTSGAAKRQLLKAKGVKAGETVSAELSGIKLPVVATQPEALPQTTDLHLPGPK